MAFAYQINGNLVQGTYTVTWAEFVKEFGFNKHRTEMIAGLAKGIAALKDCGCSIIYIGGSFATKKNDPKDIDVCFDPTGMDIGKLLLKYPVFRDFSNGRLNQKLAYKSEFHPATGLAAPPRELYLEFFQKDRDDNPKGIIKINI